MKKGNMNLKIMEKGKPRDVIIKEGELFVLPSRIPHSPQRFQDTMGLVIERERLPEEMDGLRWYTTEGEPLYEEWFHCTDLGVQLKPVIERFYASEQKQTGMLINFESVFHLNST
jgi:3-hydroxyanthranilate 3,4-dioxygenase